LSTRASASLRQPNEAAARLNKLFAADEIVLLAQTSDATVVLGSLISFADAPKIMKSFMKFVLYKKYFFQSPADHAGFSHFGGFDGLGQNTLEMQ
jgi:hypothetical protein